MLIGPLAITPTTADLLGRAMSEMSRPHSLDTYRSRLDRSLFGWSVNGDLACVAGLSDARPEGELLHLATDPAKEGRGHARRLVHSLFDELALTSITAETDDDAVGFYRRLGFAVTTAPSPWPGTARYRCRLERG